MPIVLIKGVTSLLLTLILIGLLWQRTWVEGQLNARKLPWLTLFWVLLRLVPFVVIYVVLGLAPSSDVQYYYYPVASSAARFEIPYTKAFNPYAPFFGYVLSPPLWLLRDPRTIVLTLLVIEAAVVWFTQRVYRPQLNRGERLFRCLIYYLMPVSFMFAVFSGQDDVLGWGVALLALWCWQRWGLAFVGGLALAVGLLITKATFVLLLVPFFFITRQKVTYVAGAALIGLPVLAWLYLNTGMEFIAQPLQEGDNLKAPNWRSVLNPILAGNLSLNANVGKFITLALLLVIVALPAFWVRTRDALTGHLPMLFIAIFSAMSVLQQNAISVYAFSFMLPLVFCLTNFRNKRETTILLSFNLLAANQPSIWWRMKQPYYTFESLTNPLYLAEYAMEWLIVAGFGWCVWLAIRQLRRGPVPVATLPDDSIPQLASSAVV